MQQLKLAYRALRSSLRPLRSKARALHGTALRGFTESQWRNRRAQQPHALPGPLVISLTSHPPRFATLALTLKCLLMQSVRADRVVLWLAAADVGRLPREVLELRDYGLEIRECAELGAFKKQVPALATWPDAFIATADDDVYYPRDWLLQLTRAYDAGRAVIPCHRAHRIALDASGVRPAPYANWRPARPGEASPLVFPTGVGGVLYPPSALHGDALRRDIFQALCPTSDDAWVYWMASRNGWQFKRVSARQFVCWPGSQAVALQNANVAGENDRQILRLCTHYGFGAVKAMMPPDRAATREAAQW